VPVRNCTVRPAVVEAVLAARSRADAAVNEPNATQSPLNSRRFKVLMVFTFHPSHKAQDEASYRFNSAAWVECPPWVKSRHFAMRE